MANTLDGLTPAEAGKLIDEWAEDQREKMQSRGFSKETADFVIMSTLDTLFAGLFKGPKRAEPYAPPGLSVAGFRVMRNDELPTNALLAIGSNGSAAIWHNGKITAGKARPERIRLALPEAKGVRQ